MANEIKYTRLVKLNDCAALINRLGAHVTFILRSEPGCGKTSIETVLAKMANDKWRRVGDLCPADNRQYIYVDCGTLQYGEVSGFIPVHATKSIEEYVGGMFHLDDPRPKVIMLDEVLKLPKVLKPIITRLMHERTVGNRPLPKGSIVFGTSNNAQDNVNDTIEAHVGNRVTILNMAKPSVREWLPWGAENGVNATLLAWVHMNPTVLDSYMSLDTDGLNANPYIFNPFKPQVTFVSPRSLEKAGYIMDDRLALGDTVTDACIAGTLGDAAAHSISTFMMMEKDIIDPKVIKADPLNAPIPGNQIVLLITLFKSPDAIKTQDDMAAYTQYVGRVTSKEIQSVWALTVIKDPRTDSLASRNGFLKQWRLDNNEYLV